ncbi:TRAP transporter large permease [Cloacibacillus porcorum]|uniref:TRAP transporter large permease n=1 Tax=Cloacibacillus porcorum TaxID=1197717 RepID=UPI003EFCC26E
MEYAVLSIVCMTLFLAFGTPVPMCFGLALAVMHFIGGVSMQGVILYGLQQIMSPVLLSVPFFIFMGGLMSESGIAKHLLDFVNIFVGRVKGGLGIVSVVTCGIIGAITGSALTGIAAIGPIMIPQMTKEGYPKGYSTALLSCSSEIGLLIPPSIAMITFGYVTDTSILACFLSTVGPGLLVITIFSIINMIYVRDMDLVVGEKISLAKKGELVSKHFIGAFPALMLPVIILGGIYGGIMTPTEAAGVSAMYAMMVGLVIYKGLNKKNLHKCAYEAATSVGSIMLLIMVCMALSQTFVLVDLPQKLADAVLNISDNKNLILLFIILLYVFLGMLVTDMISIFLVVPLILPLVNAIGVDTVHFAAITGVTLAMTGVTPPYAPLLYLGMKIGDTDLANTMKPTLILLCLGYLPVVLLTTYVPQISLFLPRLFGLAQ